MFEAWRHPGVARPWCTRQRLAQDRDAGVDLSGTGQPAFVTVTVGWPTRHRLVFVPLAGRIVGPGYLKVTYPRHQVKDAPSIGTDAELPAGDEEAIFKHCDLACQPGGGGERRFARRWCQGRPGGARKIRRREMVLFLLPVMAAITLGIVGAVIKSLSYLLIIGVVLLLAGLVLLGTPAQQNTPVPWPVRPRSEFLLVTPSPPAGQQGVRCPPSRAAAGPVSGAGVTGLCGRPCWWPRSWWARRGGKAGTGRLRAG
jgi:hypothetical protein